jgi:2-polyprenyl-3-methyl-5-hydroxy-6-metoxy-1,4-benzoquinol methylase
MNNKTDWRQGRRVIANRYEGNDFGYVLHAAKVVADVLNLINVPLPDLKGKRVLDYGAGTGRIAKVLSFFFKEAVAYDPIKELARDNAWELLKSNVVAGTDLVGINYKYTNDLSDIIPGSFDYAVCVSVLEHLTAQEQYVLLKNIKASLKVGGCAVVYSPDDMPLPIVAEFYPGDSAMLFVKGRKRQIHRKILKKFNDNELRTFKPGE